MLIKVKVFPESKKKEIVKKAEDKFEVKIKEKAEQGMANEAAMDALAGYFNIPRGKMRIIKGHKQRSKIIEIHPVK